jgi:hypothetical protein
MMKRKLMLAALALVITSGGASAFTIEQSDVIAVASLAQWAGLDDHCPRPAGRTQKEKPPGGRLSIQT